MKALVIGGTQGFGKEVTDNLASHNFDVVTVGRSKNSDFICDIGNLNKWKNTLEEILCSHSSFDLIVFNVGYARGISAKDLTIEYWYEHLNKNLLYVALGVEVLKSTLSASLNPKIITIGSQWSYKIGSDLLIPYVISKHALNIFTQDFAIRNPKIKANHYCVPTMDTPQYKKVMESFEKINKIGNLPTIIASLNIIAKNLIHHCLNFDMSGKTMVFNSQGEITSMELNYQFKN